MAEDTFKNTVFAFILVSLFGMLILTATYSFAGTYGKDTAVLGGALSLDKFNRTVTSVETNALALQGRFESGSVWSVLAGVVVEGIFGIAKDMITMILMPFDIVNDIAQDNLGIPAYVTSVILGILIMSIIFSVWRLIRIGD